MQDRLLEQREQLPLLIRYRQEWIPLDRIDFHRFPQRPADTRPSGVQPGDAMLPYRSHLAQDLYSDAYRPFADLCQDGEECVDVLAGEDAFHSERIQVSVGALVEEMGLHDAVFLQVVDDHRE